MIMPLFLHTFFCFQSLNMNSVLEGAVWCMNLYTRSRRKGKASLHVAQTLEPLTVFMKLSFN